MSACVREHERIVLICSKASLERSGVQNEIERVLEREAREGGASLLIPVTLDRFVFDEWRPRSPDIAEQLRSRVIMTLPALESTQEVYTTACAPLLIALKRSGFLGRGQSGLQT